MTSFRATDAQLTIAGGSVRCGSCLHVFNASAQTLAADDQPFITAASSADNSQHPDLDGSAFDRIFDDDPVQQEQQSEATEPWTLPVDKLGTSSAAEDNQHYINNSASSLDGEFEFEDLTEDLAAPAAVLESARASVNRTEEAFSEGVLDLHYSKHDTAPQPPSVSEHLDEEPHNPIAPPDDQPSEPVEPEFIFDSESIVAGERIGHPTSDYIAHIEPVPVEIAQQQQHSPWIARSWLAAIVLALLTLLAQAIYFNIDTLARGDSRAALVRVCAVLGCAVPIQHDIEQIRSSKLMVRSHPDTANALVVDAIINNGAAFKQHFPAVELLFSTIDGSPVARRVFAPAEYLHGELSGSTIMPSRQPVYIAFEIVDPGPSASNYQLLFHAN